MRKDIVKEIKNLLRKNIPIQTITEAYNIPLEIIKQIPLTLSFIPQKLIAKYMHNDNVRSVAWSPDGRYIASGLYGGSVVVYDVVAGEVIAEYKPGGPIYSVAWSPDGRYIASGLLNGNVVVYDVVAGEVIAEYKPGELIHSIAWSPDGIYIAVGSGQGVFVYG